MSVSATGYNSREGGIGVLFDDIYIIDGKRTPFGKFTGSLSTVSPTDLGIHSSIAALEASGIDGGEVDQVIASNIGQANSDCFFLPRHIALYAGTPLTAPALLVQRICGSGVEVLGQAAEQIALGKANVVLGCGTDTMSRYPLVSYSARQGFPLGRPDYVDLLWEALNDTAAVPMGKTADNLNQRNISKKYYIDGVADTIARREKVSPALVKAVIKVESDYNIRAVSRKGASGLMQLMPSTIKELNVKGGFDIYENINGGVKYLRSLLTKYNGDYKLALAAYNCGPSKVDAAGGMVPDITETKNYVSRVLDIYSKEK